MAPPAKKPVVVAQAKRFAPLTTVPAPGHRRAAEPKDRDAARRRRSNSRRSPTSPLLTPAPDTNPPSAAELSRVLAHMKVSLTKELYANFELFLYVSKADHGPWQQRMYVFQKQASGDLDMLYSFPVSTGHEALVPGPTGRLLKTDTPQGYYELDPDRMYRRYHSSQWDQSMPYAMFFTWEHDGQQTGLAIHSATATTSRSWASGRARAAFAWRRKTRNCCSI